MNARPILFSGAMVRAILAGHKKQTRRIMNPQPPSGLFPSGIVLCSTNQKEQGNHVFYNQKPCPTERFSVKNPYGKSGDTLWVREEHRLASWRLDTGHMNVVYHADGAERRCVAAPAECVKLTKRKTPLSEWMRARFMLRSFARLELEVVAVRAERLQEISEADAMAEGITLCGCTRHETECRDAYRALWESINGQGSWEENPWVWVVEFRRVAEDAFR